MSSIMNRLTKRNKSSDKMLSNPIYSNQSNMNRAAQKKRTTSGNNNLNIKPTIRKSNSAISTKKQKEMHFEGDLNFSSSRNSQKKVSEKSNNKIYNLINKNISSKIPIANLNRFKSGSKPLTRKSPIPISSSNYLNYNINRMNNIYSSINKSNNFLIKSHSNQFFKTQKKNVDRSYSPIARVNEQAPKLSPNLVRPKYISKSPLLNNSSLINGFKRFNNASLNNRPSSGISKRLINHIKVDKQMNRPKSSNNLSNNINRISRQYNHNSISHDKNKNHIGNILSFNANNFNNTGNINVIQNISIVRPDSNISNEKNYFKESRNNINHNSDNYDSSQRHNINNYKPDNNYNYLKDNTNSPVNKSDIKNNNIQSINRQINNSNSSNNLSNSHYTYVPVNNYNSKLRSISALPPSQMSNHQIEDTYKKKIKNIHQFTHVGYDGGKDKDNNQDKGFIEKMFANYSDYMFLICDGHGCYGHHVSEYIKNTLPKDLSKNLHRKEIATSNPLKKEAIYTIIKNTFVNVNQKLVDNGGINSVFSGSTCVSVIYTPTKLICANIGDSRAVLGKYKEQENKWTALALSRDHKPNDSDEKRRILANGGEIHPFTDDNGEFTGPERVWIKGQEVPGLAMSRSFGDQAAASVGTISVPEIFSFDLGEEDKFLIIASDGIWEWMSNEEVINHIIPYYKKNDAKGCCEYLYKISKEKWLDDDDYIDDITMILVFFD